MILYSKLNIRIVIVYICIGMSKDYICGHFRIMHKYVAYSITSQIFRNVLCGHLKNEHDLSECQNI